MNSLLGIVLGVVIAVVLSPLLWRLARRWRRGTAAMTAGSVLPGNDIGGYITNLRTGGSDTHAHGDSSAGGGDAADGSSD